MIKEASQIFSSLVRCTRSSEDCLAVAFENAQPVADIIRMIRAWFNGNTKVATQECRTQLGNHFFHSVGIVAEPYKPTTMLARFEAQTDLKIFNQKLGRPAGEVTLTEDQYREKLAEAERRGQAKAEIVFQREMANVQADKELLVGAYQSLYQRANIIAQAAVQIEVVATQFRQRLMEMTNGGRSVVIGVKDIFCGLGSPEACDSAHADRQNMIGEATELTKGQVAQQVNELMAEVPDPATLMVRAHANSSR